MSSHHPVVVRPGVSLPLPVRGMLVRRGCSGRRGDLFRAEDEERQLGGQPGDRHVEEFAVTKGLVPHGLLRAVA